MESQPLNPELRINPINFHLISHSHNHSPSLNTSFLSVVCPQPMLENSISFSLQTFLEGIQ